MKKIFNVICTVSLAAGLTFGFSNVTHAAWEDMNYLNTCNTAEDIPSAGAELINDTADRSPDGTAYLKGSQNSDLWLYNQNNPPLNIAFEAVFSSSSVTSFCTWETDIKFSADYSGFSIRNNKGATAGKINTTIIYYNGALHFSKESGTTICNASTDKWYHVKITGAYGTEQDSSVLKLTVSQYNDDGSLTEVAAVSYPGAKYGEIMRNNSAPTRFVFNPGTCVDNIKAYKLKPLIFETSPASNEAQAISAGEDIQFESFIYADEDKTMKISDIPVIYELWNADKTDYLISDTISISPEGGLLSTTAAAENTTFTVVATCSDFPELRSETTITVSGLPILEFEGAGFNEDYTTLVNLKYTQNYENEGDMTFSVGFYDESGRLIDIYSKNLAYRDQVTGTLYITFNKELPPEFDPDSGEMKVFVWSKTIK